MSADRIVTGDTFDVLPTLGAESVHAVVTDPPYGLAFMGRDWDDFEPKEYQEWCEKWAREVKRVLKPGGHLLAFSGNRTHHRLFTGVEDAGFEIRDTLTWHYGSGFPKASDVSKTIDKRADAEREVVEEVHAASEGLERPTENSSSLEGSVDGSLGWHYDKTAPTTDAAKKWDGWKTGLKPATEYIVMARKPFDGATVDCVLEHGTGALNIDGTRIGHDGDDLDGGATDVETTANYKGGWERPWMNDEQKKQEYADEMKKKVEKAEQEGRYPSNVIFDETAADALDAKNETTTSTGGTSYERFDNGAWMSDERSAEHNNPGLGDTGGPSRYFYTSKASRSERTENGQIANDHPTVKPGDLMQWLIRLVTREGQTVLDPFVGSGTTCKAAKALGRQFLGIERQAKYADIARVRCGLTPDDPATVREDDAQRGFEAYTDGGASK